MQPLIVCNSCKKVKVKYGEIENSSICEDCYGKLFKSNEIINRNNLDFIAIDFEIANNKMSSACSLGLAFVKDNKIIDEKYYLIQPPTMQFDNATIKIHGLTANDVINAKKFNEIWEEIKHYFNEIPIIAHNAQFDMSVLHSCITEYSLELPEFEYICSIPISTKACREKVGNSLTDRLAHFNIKLNDHHNALADSRACAELVLACLEVKKRKSLQTYISMFGQGITVHKFSELNPQTYFGKNGKFRSKRIAISEIAVTVETIKTNHPFFGKNVVFTGDMSTIDRKEAMQLVVNAGGIIKSGVSSITNYLVVGKQDLSLVGDEGKSTKEKKAYDFIEKGKNIKIIRESEFLRLIES